MGQMYHWQQHMTKRIIPIAVAIAALIPLTQLNGAQSAIASVTSQPEDGDVTDALQRERVDPPITPSVNNTKTGDEIVIPNTIKDLPKSKLLAEGSFIISQPAKLLQADKGNAWYLFFEKGAPNGIRYSSKNDPHILLLLPSRRLERLEQMLDQNPSLNQLSVSGQVFVYQKRNYLMLTTLPRMIENTPETVAEPTHTSDTPGNAQPLTDTGDIDVDRIIQELEAEGLNDPIPSLVRTPNADADEGDDQPSSTSSSTGKRPPNLKPEGAFVINRSGRLISTHAADGVWAFHFEADKNGLSDPPMIVIPCRLLDYMQRKARKQSDTIRLVVSGQVLVYHGQNYLLPTMMKIPYERNNLSP